MSDRNIYIDPAGRTWRRYLLTWSGPDGQFVTDLWALSREHAELVLADLKLTARIEGQVVEEQPL